MKSLATVSLLAIALAGCAGSTVRTAPATSASAASAGTPAATPAMADAFIADAEKQLFALNVLQQRASWINQTYITDDSEMQLIAKLAEYPRIIEAAAQSQEPHRLAFYLYDLASFFHAHWNKGKDQPELRFVNDKNRELSIARLGLVRAVASVLKSGLAVTGTAAPEEMR